MIAKLLCLGVALGGLALPARPLLAAPWMPEIRIARVDRLRVTALARAGKRLVAAGERGRILFSDDQGRTWQTATSPASAGLTDISFSDSGYGLAVGHNATLLRSVDGGKTWNAIDLAVRDQPALFAVYIDAARAIAIGAYGAYFESGDAGKSWQLRRIIGGDFDRHLYGIVMAHPGILMIAGEAGTLLRSTDGGQNWKLLDSPYAGSYFGILGLKSGSVIAYGMRGHAYRSDDDGGHWQRIDLGGTHSSIQGGRELADGSVLLYGNDGLVALQDKGQGAFRLERLSNRRTVASMIRVGDRFLDVGPSGVHWSRDEVAKR